MWHVSASKKEDRDEDFGVVLKRCLLLSVLNTTDGHLVGHRRVYRQPTYFAMIVQFILAAHIGYKIQKIVREI